MLAKRLKIARAAAGYSLRDLSAKIDKRVTAQAIGKYERGESMPDSGVLVALAEALKVSTDYLLGEQEMVFEGVEFRKTKGVGRRDEMRLEASIIRLLECYLMVEELLGLRSVEWRYPREAPYPVVRDIAEADRAAQALRSHWDIGTDPVPNFFELLEEQGIKVLPADLPDIDGLTARVRRRQKPSVTVILVNDRHSSERQRFTLARELGHLIMNIAATIDAERAANRFAGAFLMPAESLWAEVGKHRTSLGGRELAALKKRFGASIHALTYRCLDLGIIGAPLFRKLIAEYDRLGWRRAHYSEPYALPREQATRFQRLTFRAYAEGALTEQKAAELLGLSARQLSAGMNVASAVETTEPE